MFPSGARKSARSFNHKTMGASDFPSSPTNVEGHFQQPSDLVLLLSIWSAQWQLLACPLRLRAAEVRGPGAGPGDLPGGGAEARGQSHGALDARWAK